MGAQNLRCKLYYKLTDAEGNTHGGTHWGPGVTHEAPGSGRDFCSPDLIHFYNSPLLAVLLNPIHADFREPRLWECEVKGTVSSDLGLKFGAKSITTTRELPVPTLSLIHI